MLGDGEIAIREAVWMEIDDDAPGQEARYQRLRVAASMLVDHLCTDYGADRKKVLGRGRDRLSVFVRAICWAALERAAYERKEIANVFGRDITVVLRSNELMVRGARFKAGRAPEHQLDSVLDHLMKLLENPPPFGPDELATPDSIMEPASLSSASRTLQAMRARYLRTVSDMIRTDPARAVRIWRNWCQEEYPFSWKSAVLILPLEYRRRHPDRLALADAGAASPGGPVWKSPEGATGQPDDATETHCTTPALRELAHAG